MKETHMARGLLRSTYQQILFGVIKSRRMRSAKHVVHVGDRRGACRDLVVRPEGNRPLGRSRCRWD